MPDFHLDAFISSMAGCALAIALAKVFLQRLMREFDRVLERVDKINSELAVIAVRLESIDRDNILVKEHDRKIAAMEQVIHGFGDLKRSKQKDLSVSPFPG